MIIIGHPWIPYSPLFFIKRTEDIAATPPGSTVIFPFGEAQLGLIAHCRDNGVPFALICDAVRDILLAQALQPHFIVCDKTLAEKAQKFADGYLFDAKILLYSGLESDMEWAADREIDGILLEEGIDYGSC